MKKFSISIIVPIYNSQDYMDRCLKSILNQTYKDIEVILVDDGSNDESLCKARLYEKEDNRVKVFSQNNKGASAARNYGLELCTGDYILFIDSDDYVEATMIEDMVNLLSENEHCMVFCNNDEIYLDRIEYRRLFNDLDDKSKITRQVAMREIASGKAGLVCCKLIPKYIVDKFNIKFDESLKISEDQLFFLYISQYIERFHYLDKPLYHYDRMNNNSITINYQSDAYKNQMYVLDKIEKVFVQNKYDSNEDRKLLWHRTKNGLWFCINNEIQTCKANNFISRYKKVNSIFVNNNRYKNYRKYIENSFIDKMIYKGISAKNPIFITMVFFILIKILIPFKQIMNGKLRTYRLKNFIEVIKLFIAWSISSILKIFKNNRDVWLIGERRNEAKDNGYHLFRYIRDNNPNKKVYYVIDRDSRELSKIQKIGNIIYYNSFKHYVYYALASKLIMAHLGSCVPDSPVCWKSQEINLLKKKRIFIQHGITIGLIPSLMYKNTGVDLFICGAKPEYDFVKNKFGYPEGFVKYAGFPRFDNLHAFKTKNQILVMPTWRKWIPSMTWSIDNKEECRKIFLESEYYIKFNELLNNEDIKGLLEKNKMELIFYPHYEMQEYIDLFSVSSNRVIIAKKDEYDVQQLLKDSKILITDYSSVAFDFAYMRKPILYYQFDNEEYYKNHYDKGYYNYDQHGFGNILYNIDNLVKELEYVLNNGQVNEYVERCDYFFNIYDNKNCERNYKYIENI